MAPSFSSRLLCIYLFLIQLLGIPTIASPLALMPPAIALQARDQESPSLDFKVWLWPPYSDFINALMVRLEKWAAAETNMFSLGVVGEKWTKEVYPELSRREREHKG
ncbi:hypothetical protein GG344DRAFT_78645 [Lentinula edodes]|nr:hypothetical protein GG344DRAFT_78645 [Lentinula edodes]